MTWRDQMFMHNFIYIMDVHVLQVCSWFIVLCSQFFLVGLQLYKLIKAYSDINFIFVWL